MPRGRHERQSPSPDVFLERSMLAERDDVMTEVANRGRQIDGVDLTAADLHPMDAYEDPHRSVTAALTTRACRASHRAATRCADRPVKRCPNRRTPDPCMHGGALPRREADPRALGEDRRRWLGDGR